ncbi:MAG: response regulator [Verrucomicrobiota bacterium]|jgi:DNA-binding response OmpR family regulator
MTTTPKPRILLTDDDEPLRSVLRRSLERSGYEVREAGTGDAALRLLANAPADLIITDIVMPGMEGIEFILSLRKTHPGLPVIAMSGGGRIEANRYLEMARVCGVAKILPKPFDLEQLIAMVQELIAPLPPTKT